MQVEGRSKYCPTTTVAEGASLIPFHQQQWPASDALDSVPATPPLTKVVSQVQADRRTPAYLLSNTGRRRNTRVTIPTFD